ncbi:MAG: hypothetical protein E4H11_03595, partial [Myxococcales bacterium]
MVRKLPADVGLFLLVVPGVRGIDGLVEGLLEGAPVLGLDRLLERRPVVAQVLLERGLVLRPRVGAELEELLRLLPLVHRVRPVPRLGRVVELPGARADLGHDAAEARLDRRDLVDRHVAPGLAHEAQRAHELLELLLVHRSSSPAVAGREHSGFRGTFCRHVLRATHRPALALLCRLLVLAGAFACAPDPPPNVVLVTLDTTRADHLGLYGYFRDTSPRLDAFATEAIVVERALAPMATTLPSHTSILTGRAPLEHGVLANLDHGGQRFAPAPGLRSFAEICLDAGYRTGAFVSAAPLERGSGLEAGFEIYHQPGEGFPQRRGEFTTHAALHWLEGVKGEPFFLWVHYYDAHWPFDPPSGYAGLFEGGPDLEAFLAARRIPDASERSGTGLESTRAVTDAYDAELRYQDAQLGRLLDALAQRPDWGRTAVAIVGDHGECLSQHGEAAHGGTWDEQLFVPLVLRVPGHAPERITAPVP